MARPLGGPQVGDQHLATPQGAVGAVPDAVEGQGHHPIGATVLDQARSHVRVVVLHPDQRQAEIVGHLGRQVLGVEVVGHRLRLDVVEVAEVVDRLEERLVRGEVLEIADVMARHDVLLARHGHRALELGAHGEDRTGRGTREANGGRRQAPRPTEHLDPPGDGPHHRVVAADVDRTVVGEQSVDQRAESLDRVLVGVGDGLVAQVAAGHHERTSDGREQEVVQRGVREHEPQLARPGGHAGGQRTVGRPPPAPPAGSGSTGPRGRRHRGSRARGRTPRRPPSQRTACRRGACGGAVRRRLAPTWHRPRGGSRRSP